MNFRDTTAPFTMPPDHWALSSGADLPAGLAFYGVSVRRLAALFQASSRQNLTILPLSFPKRSYIIKLNDHIVIHQQGTFTP
jgi:hypothetical protein